MKTHFKDRRDYNPFKPILFILLEIIFIAEVSYVAIILPRDTEYIIIPVLLGYFALSSLPRFIKKICRNKSDDYVDKDKGLASL